VHGSWQAEGKALWRSASRFIIASGGVTAFANAGCLHEAAWSKDHRHVLASPNASEKVLESVLENVRKSVLGRCAAAISSSDYSSASFLRDL
jgi:hypothetical protein